MHNLKDLRNNLESFKKKLKERNVEFDIDNFNRIDKDNLKVIMEEPKRMVFDEFHRTSKSPVVREQIVQDMREGRKWKIHISLASQSLKDFDPLMIEFATSISTI